MWIFLDHDPYRPVIGSEHYGLFTIIDDPLHRPIAAATMYAKLALGDLADDPTVDREGIETTTCSRARP